MTEQTSLIIRNFALKDLDAVIDINRRCLPENYPEGFFRTIFSECPRGFILAEVDGSIVGYTMGRIESGLSLFSIFHRAKKGHTVSIAVLPEYRRNKIASKLISASTKGMRGYGAEELFLEVRISNSVAVKLYESLGYKVIKELRHYYRDMEGAYLMAKKMKKKDK
ncbi:MAG: GNAT family N-acetyltransferase [Candidatus Hodarchaeales archaeon]|jgi:ribosomal-protein-alanine N-acetyltransferase